MSKLYILLLSITLSFLSCGKQDTSKTDKNIKICPTASKKFIWHGN